MTLGPLTLLSLSLSHTPLTTHTHALRKPRAAGVTSFVSHSPFLQNSAFIKFISGSQRHPQNGLPKQDFTLSMLSPASLPAFHCTPGILPSRASCRLVPMASKQPCFTCASKRKEVSLDQQGHRKAFRVEDIHLLLGCVEEGKG
jgi:hypothetical protein